MKEPKPATPGIIVAAILAGCAVTLIGVLKGLDPDVILWRASISALVIGLTAAIVTRLFARVLDE